MARSSLLSCRSDLEAGASVSIKPSVLPAPGIRNINSEEPGSETGSMNDSPLNTRLEDAPKKKSFKTEFAGENGQALLFAFDNGKSGVSAFEVQVNRPSYQWSEAVMRQKSPDEATPERIAEFRESIEYESEECIWRRIAEEWHLNQPRWQRYLPFWRPTGLEERMVRKENALPLDSGNAYFPLAGSFQQQKTLF